jgi:hypothetical protein
MWITISPYASREMQRSMLGRRQAADYNEVEVERDGKVKQLEAAALMMTSATSFSTCVG